MHKVSEYALRFTEYALRFLQNLHKGIHSECVISGIKSVYNQSDKILEFWLVVYLIPLANIVSSTRCKNVCQ